MNSLRIVMLSSVWLFSLLPGASNRLAAQESRDEPPLIMAHYMPWYSADEGAGRWGWHWTMNHFDPTRVTEGRREIASHHYPLIGPYDSTDPIVVDYHLLTMKAAGIDGVIIDWYGREEFRDYAQLHRATSLVIERAEALDMKFIICYEDQILGAQVEAGLLLEDQTVARAQDDIRWVAEHWFPLRGYVRLDDRPILLSFGQNGLSNSQWTECLKGIDLPLHYVSLHRRRETASGAYDWPLPAEGLDAVKRFESESRAWSLAIPVAFPRFVDIYEQAGLHDSWGTIHDDDGRTFRATLARALASRPRIVQIATWNDWGEGTEIEPSHEFGYRDLEEIQRRRKTWDPDYTEATADDIRLGYLLYEARRADPDGSHQEQYDRLVQAIVKCEWPRARAQAASLEDRTR
ncbi:MAG: glycoside hydrolase family 99-like domain-containing protein [Planctomycetales bacterium]|nr:glycoside hydrolase family 99-like domain-containing protein [Planctomycetales bacterium]